MLLSLVRITLICLLMALSPAILSQPVHVISLEKPTDISGIWKYKIGDDVNWASPDFNDTDWATIPVPLDWGKFGLNKNFNYLWYRLDIHFDKTTLDQQDLGRLGINIGRVFSAYELYANGTFIGSVGKFPPNSQARYDQEATFDLPRHTLNDDGTVVIALRVWRENYLFGGNQGGAGDGTYQVGTRQNLLTTNLWSIVIPIGLASIYFLVGINHLYLYRHNSQLTEYFWVGVMALALSVYTVLISRWREQIPLDYWLLKQIEYTAIFATPTAATLFITNMLKFKPSKLITFYQYSFLVFVFVTWFHPGLDCICTLVTPWQIWSMAAIIITPCFILLKAVKGNAEARILFGGVFLFSLATANDLMVVNRALETPRLLPIGFLAIVLSMAFSLVRRFTYSYSELELTVQNRTEELEQKNKELDKMAHIDPLTQTFNRRSFDDTVLQKVEQHRQNQTPFHIALCDIDNFKTINDTYGHSFGDLVLASLSDAIKTELRDEDFLARWGGEEFIIILQESDKQRCAQALERIRLTVEQLALATETSTVGVTITIGISEYDGSKNLKDVINDSDEALYKGKENGKNQIVFS
ncbi:MAG: diguanylate cyclase (GGDEF)-like protein [Pseudomonadales bacterium]|jgi:diguanylate cyclase (GGDEF)-like protein